MVSLAMLILCMGLGVCWTFGMVEPRGPWVAWVDGILAVVGLAAATAIGTFRRSKLLFPIGMGFAVLTVWVLCLANEVASWLTWSNLALAIGFLATGIFSSEEFLKSTEVENPPAALTRKAA